MANKTTLNDQNVEAFLNTVEQEQKREDSYTLLKLMQQLSGFEPKMWGSSIVGFGSYHYKYESGREGDFFKVGFSPRKQNLTIYIMPGFERYRELMAELGKYKTGKSCLYIKKLTDVKMEILTELIQGSLDYMNNKYG